MDLLKNPSHCTLSSGEGGGHHYDSFQVEKYSVQLAEGRDFQYGHDGV
jgi:hypothetical protein